MEEHNTQKRFSLDRLNGLSDGVFAIALTLLVLAIDIPEDHDFTHDGLKLFLIKLEPSFIAYVSSFIIIAIYWMQQHAIFRTLKYTSNGFTWLNTLFLFAISVAPFMSKIKTLYRYDASVVMLFAITNILSGLILFFMWRYVLSHPELQAKPIDEKLRKSMRNRIFIVPFICLIAIPLAFINVHVGTYIFITIPVFYMGTIQMDK